MTTQTHAHPEVRMAARAQLTSYWLPLLTLAVQGIKPPFIH